MQWLEGVVGHLSLQNCDISFDMSAIPFVNTFLQAILFQFIGSLDFDIASSCLFESFSFCNILAGEPLLRYFPLRCLGILFKMLNCTLCYRKPSSCGGNVAPKHGDALYLLYILGFWCWCGVHDFLQAHHCAFLAEFRIRYFPNLEHNNEGHYHHLRSQRMSEIPFSDTELTNHSLLPWVWGTQRMLGQNLHPESQISTPWQSTHPGFVHDERTLLPIHPCVLTQRCSHQISLKSLFCRRV